MPSKNYSKKDEKKKTKKEIQELISKEIIEISENKKNAIPNSIEKCVCCGTDTIWRRSISIHMRQNYVEGIGQLCDICYPKESFLPFDMFTM